MTETPPREFTGRDLVEALQEAARSFGVRRSELGHEIIENYGVGARGCVIRAWPKANAGGGRSGGFDRPPRSERPPREDRGPRDDRPRDDRPRDDRPREDRGPARRGGGFEGGRRSAAPGGGPGGGRGRRDFGGRGGGARHDLPDSVAKQAPPERSRGGMYDDSMPARLSDRPPGQRDDRFRRGGGGGGFRRRDDRGGDRRGPAGRGDGGGRPEGRSGGRGGGRFERGGGSGDRAQSDWGQRGGQARRPPQGGGRPPRQEGGEEQGGRRRRRRGERGGAGEGHPAQQRRSFRSQEPPRREPTVPATEEHAAEVRDLLEEIVDRWGMDLHAESRVDGDTVLVSINGPDAERLSAEDGKLLDSLQYLLSKMTSRLLTDNVRVLLDAAGFRSGRDQDLRDRASAKAHEALDSGKKLRLDPLNPYERRVVHLALKEIPGIRTYSIGRGYLKRVTIEPLREDEGEGETNDDSEE